MRIGEKSPFTCSEPLSLGIMKTRSRPGIALVFLVAATASQSGLAAGLERSGNFSATIPTPEQVLGFTPGERPVRYAEAMAYYEALAAASNRVKLRDYGRTSAKRRLLEL